MRILIPLAGLSLLMLLMGCPQSHETTPPPPTNVHELWPRGSAPVPSPLGERVLFTQEEPPSGLYVLQNNAATIVNPAGPAARTDYTWSPDGQRIAFSGPGLPGSPEAGIWISDAGNVSSLTRIWDRGSHPRFYPVETLMVCAGPEGDGNNAGIWEMDFAGANRNQLSPIGVDPEVSPDGVRIAYLVTTGGSNGRTMIVYNRVTHIRDTVAVNVLRHEWLSDSQALVYETTRPIGNFEEVPEIHTVGPNDDLLGVRIAEGTAPAAMKDNGGFLFTAISNYVAVGIYRAALGESPVLISGYGTNARHAGGNRAVAQDSTTLIEILF